MLSHFRRMRLLFMVIATLFSVACTGILPAPVETSVPSPVPSITATIQWFPATITPSPFPTPVSIPTQEGLTGLGSLLLSDQFEDASQWTPGVAGSNSIVVERNRITLTSSGRAPLLSLRQEPVLTDFYATLTARLSLCREGDAYGLLFRAAGTGDHYRLAVNCRGQVRPERVHNGQLVPLAEWLPSGDAPGGAPGEVRLGVWMAGNEMRLFLNDRHQITVRDPVHTFGTLGIYILPGGENEQIISFSDLTIVQVDHVPVVPTDTGTPQP